MRLGTPRWWYVRHGAPAPITRALLKPISWIWTAATAERIAKARPVDPGIPVISIGNLTMGGSGKTPVAREVLARLRAMGAETHGLSRGYGGREAGPLRIDPAIHTAADVGDEPLMLAGDGPFWIARDRADGALTAARAGARTLVLDDGHQNPALRKALSIIVVDGETRNGEWPFGDGSVFPAGPMREPLAVGLKRADAVVLMLPADLAEPDPELLALFGGKPVLVAHLQSAEPPPPGPQFGFAGIAKPWKVEAALKAAGCDLVDFGSFPDHAAFSEDTLRFLEDRAKVFSAGLITTEKDWVRLPPAWRAKVRAWPVKAVFNDPAALDRLLQTALAIAPGAGTG